MLKDHEQGLAIAYKKLTFAGTYFCTADGDLPV